MSVGEAGRRVCEVGDRAGDPSCRVGAGRQRRDQRGEQTDSERERIRRGVGLFDVPARLGADLPADLPEVLVEDPRSGSADRRLRRPAGWGSREPGCGTGHRRHERRHQHDPQPEQRRVERVDHCPGDPEFGYRLLAELTLGLGSRTYIRRSVVACASHQPGDLQQVPGPVVVMPEIGPDTALKLRNGDVQELALLGGQVPA